MFAVESNHQNLLKSFVQGWDIIFSEQVGIFTEDIRTDYWRGDSDFKKESSKMVWKVETLIEIDEPEQKVQEQDLVMPDSWMTYTKFQLHTQ